MKNTGGAGEQKPLQGINTPAHGVAAKSGDEPECELPAEQPSFLPERKALLIVLSGPSGVGKDTVIETIKKSGFPIKHVITMTTRAPRPNEKNNVDYIFAPVSEFENLIKNNGLLEWAKVYENYYGVPRGPIREALASGQDTLVKVDIQGAATIKKLVPDAVFIFIAPPSLNTCAMRLQQRNTESKNDLETRLKIASDEMSHLPTFDYCVVNKEGKASIAADEIKAIIAAEKCRTRQRNISL
jgi:guanylate kinase